MSLAQPRWSRFSPEGPRLRPRRRGPSGENRLQRGSVWLISVLDIYRLSLV